MEVFIGMFFALLFLSIVFPVVNAACDYQMNPTKANAKNVFKQFLIGPLTSLAIVVKWIITLFKTASKNDQ